MGESLMQRRRVRKKAFGVNLFRRDEAPRVNSPEVTVPPEEAPANYVPAAAVIRRGKRCPDLLGVKSV